MVDKQCALGLPHAPGLLGDLFIDTLAQLARHRRLLQTRELTTQLDTVDHSWHGRYPTLSLKMLFGYMVSNAENNVKYA
ncbi:hypothetical protein KTAU_22280 [Thermogemmatispora aurantia]|uniref:Uncharacterized protein n=1 Tax=Thermogemmatispora aurantia TaxID=2045279 RepID=A0A5J4KAA0_9CHLR|nr:hypothetical protein KTAU_22280 [Thermogemmatispora aurantia]